MTDTPTKTYAQKRRETARATIPHMLRNLNLCQQELNDQLAALLRSEASPGAATRIEKAALRGIVEMVKDDARILGHALDEALQEDDTTASPAGWEDGQS